MLTLSRHKIVLFKNSPGRVALSVCALLEVRPMNHAHSQFHTPPTTLHNRIESVLRSPANANQARVCFLQPADYSLQPLLTGCITYQSPEEANRQTAAERLR